MVNIGKGHHQGLCFGDGIVCSRLLGFGTVFGDMHQNLHWVVVVVVPL